MTIASIFVLLTTEGECFFNIRTSFIVRFYQLRCPLTLLNSSFVFTISTYIRCRHSMFHWWSVRNCAIESTYFAEKWEIDDSIRIKFQNWTICR